MNFNSNNIQKQNKNILLVFFTLFICLITPTIVSAQSKAPQEDDLIIGEWFPLNTSRTGLGSGITIYKDGKIKRTVGAYVTYKYKIEGDTLTSLSPKNPEIKNKIEINDTNLIISYGEFNMELTRIAGDSNSGIVGKWESDQVDGIKRIIDYTTSNNAYLSVPMSSEQGIYKIKGDIIEFSFKKTTSYKWFVNGNNLTLTSNDNEKTSNFVKIK